MSRSYFPIEQRTAVCEKKREERPSIEVEHGVHRDSGDVYFVVCPNQWGSSRRCSISHRECSYTNSTTKKAFFS